jgi:glycosyltransferase involved in cell wall biosynthesis
MSRIAILAPCIMMADAVSNDALGMYQVLAAQGHEVRLFAGNWEIAEPKVQHVRRLQAYLKDHSSLLIYHYSMGWATGLTLLKEVSCKKVIKYHNVTPPEFYDGVSDDYKNVCQAGRNQLNAITHVGCDLYLSDSAYNMQELIFVGANRDISIVVPPFHQIHRSMALEADLAIVDAYRDDKTNILMVGRVAPNKGHALLIDAFAVYHYNYNNASRLLIVGKEDERLRAYTEALHQQVQQLELGKAVIFTGKVSEAALKAYYLVADVFMLTSEHEGFCVPLVEAMAMKLPIVAYGASAVPATVDRAGLVWQESDPELLAESLHCVIEDESTAVALGAMGWRRYHQLYTNEQIAVQFLQALNGVL